jgi:hypothetical protein
LIDNPSYQDFATHDDSAYPELWGGCVGAWAPCLGPSGTRLQDNSGRQNWGTLTDMDAATDWVVDGGHYALDIDGANDHLQLASPVTLAADFGFSGWFYIRSTSAQVFWTYTVSGITVFFLNTATTISFRAQGSQLVTFTIPAITNTWAHIAVTRTGDSVRLFVNGVESTSGALTSTGAVIFDRCGISFFGTAPLNALVDDQFMKNGAFSRNEISRLYRLGRSGIYAPRQRRKAYLAGPSFNAAWARGSNVILQPSVGVA